MTALAASSKAFCLSFIVIRAIDPKQSGPKTPKERVRQEPTLPKSTGSSVVLDRSYKLGDDTVQEKYFGRRGERSEAIQHAVHAWSAAQEWRESFGKRG